MAQGQNEPAGAQARAEDVSSIDGLMRAAYEAVSALPGEERDLDRFRSLFRPDARLVAVSRQDGQVQTAILGLDDFARSFAGAVPRGVYEEEIHRRSELFGDIAHVWSVYEIRAAPDSEQVQVRGINSLQLVFDGQRWWVASGVFQNEGEGVRLPREYLGNRKESGASP